MQPPLTHVNTLQFEFAYLLVKIQEQLLEDDVQYNFVEHFYTGEAVPLTPQVVLILYGFTFPFLARYSRHPPSPPTNPCSVCAVAD